MNCIYIVGKLEVSAVELIHSFSKKLHIKGSAGHFVNAVSLSTVLNRILQSYINIEATQTILTSLRKLKDFAVELFTFL